MQIVAEQRLADDCEGTRVCYGWLWTLCTRPPDHPVFSNKLLWHSKQRWCNFGFGSQPGFGSKTDSSPTSDYPEVIWQCWCWRWPTASWYMDAGKAFQNKMDPAVGFDVESMGHGCARSTSISGLIPLSLLTSKYMISGMYANPNGCMSWQLGAAQLLWLFDGGAKCAVPKSLHFVMLAHHTLLRMKHQHSEIWWYDFCSNYQRLLCDCICGLCQWGASTCEPYPYLLD